jgi:hypothetical protein
MVRFYDLEDDAVACIVRERHDLALEIIRSRS